MRGLVGPLVKIYKAGEKESAWNKLVGVGNSIK